MPPRPPTREPLRDLQEWIAGNLDGDLSVPALAERAHMSERNFARAFRRELGLTPAAYVEVARVEAARIALESTGTPVEVVAARRGSAPSRPCAARSTAAWAWARPSTAPASPRPKPPRKEETMDIAIPLYDRFTALDAIGPYEVLSRIPDSRVTFVGTEAGPYKTDNGMLTILAEASLDDLPNPEIICVPGGWGTRDAMSDERILDWIRGAHETSEWTTSVCTGSLLLGAAGVLEGLDATSHWLELETLAELGATPTGRRVVEQGKVVTAAGVSSGIDMALVPAGEDRR